MEGYVGKIKAYVGKCTAYFGKYLVYPGVAWKILGGYEFPDTSALVLKKPLVEQALEVKQSHFGCGTCNENAVLTKQTVGTYTMDLYVVNIIAPISFSVKNAWSYQKYMSIKGFQRFT